MSLAEEQIKTAFLQSEKEVRDLHVRISQGMRESKLNGTKIGLLKGTKLITKKSITCKDIIKKHMWPLTIIPPACREAWIVTAADKYCSLLETLKLRRGSGKTRMEIAK